MSVPTGGALDPRGGSSSARQGESEPRPRSLSGEKARRIVEAMRESVGEVGIAGSTFDRVSAKAGVSRGLLHYYFGTKERLLVEVIRRDTALRIEARGAVLREATTVEEVIDAFADRFGHTLAEHPAPIDLVAELYVAARQSAELRRELGALYRRERGAFAEILREKEAEGVVRLRFDAESVLAYLFAAGDGAAIQRLADPDLDAVALGRCGVEVARFLLDARDARQ